MKARELIDIVLEVRKALDDDDAVREKSMLAFRSQNPHVPTRYRLDPESNCLGNSEALADMNPKLELVTGYCKSPGERRWGSHQWCVARDGTIVDPYFEWRFGPSHQQFSYRPAKEDEDPFY